MYVKVKTQKFVLKILRYFFQKQNLVRARFRFSLCLGLDKKIVPLSNRFKKIASLIGHSSILSSNMSKCDMTDSTSFPFYLSPCLFSKCHIRYMALSFSLSLFLSFSLSLFLSFSLFRFIAFSLSRFLVFSFLFLSLSLFLSFSLSLFLSFSLSLVVSFPRSLFLLFSPSLVLSFSLSRFLSFSRSLFLSFSLFLFLPFAPSRFLYLSLEMSNGIQQLVDSNMSKCDITDSTGNATRPHSTKSRNSYFSQNSNYTKIQFQFVLRDRYRQV